MAWPFKADLILRQRQFLAERNPQLPFDEIDARDQFGDGMLDLKPRVHLDEEHVLPLETNSMVPAPT